MFTGIVERTARVVEARGGTAGLRLGLAIDAVAGAEAWRPVVLGESIAVNGVCLTVVEFDNAEGLGRVAFEVVPESLEKTALGELRPGHRVNLERSLRVGDILGGHWVTGHVDGVGRVRARRPEGDQVLFEISAAPQLIRQMLAKGSIAVDGISLTLVDVERREGWFSFAAIPHTLEWTQLGDRQVGDTVHLETDAFGKWVLHAIDDLTAADGGDRSGPGGGRNLGALLASSGYKAAGGFRSAGDTPRGPTPA